MFIDPFPLVIIRAFVRFSKLPLPLVWKRIRWFVSTNGLIGFLSLIAINVCWNFLINLHVSSKTEFSKKQNKISNRTVYHKHYCYRISFSRFAARLLSKTAVICRNYNNYASLILNLTFFSQYFDLQFWFASI